jgi:hypothetical protein
MPLGAIFSEMKKIRKRLKIKAKSDFSSKRAYGYYNAKLRKNQAEYKKNAK